MESGTNFGTKFIRAPDALLPCTHVLRLLREPGGGRRKAASLLGRPVGGSADRTAVRLYRRRELAFAQRRLVNGPVEACLHGAAESWACAVGCNSRHEAARHGPVRAREFGTNFGTKVPPTQGLTKGAFYSLGLDYAAFGWPPESRASIWARGGSCTVPRSRRRKRSRSAAAARDQRAKPCASSGWTSSSCPSG